MSVCTWLTELWLSHIYEIHRSLLSFKINNNKKNKCSFLSGWLFIRFNQFFSFHPFISKILRILFFSLSLLCQQAISISIYLPIDLSVYPSIYLAIYLSVYLYIYLYVSVYLFLHVSIYIYTFIYISIYTSISLCLYL